MANHLLWRDGDHSVFISILLATISFAFIPVFPRLLDPTSKKSKPEPAPANEGAVA